MKIYVKEKNRFLVMSRHRRLCLISDYLMVTMMQTTEMRQEQAISILLVFGHAYCGKIRDLEVCFNSLLKVHKRFNLIEQINLGVQYVK